MIHMIQELFGQTLRAEAEGVIRHSPKPRRRVTPSAKTRPTGSTRSPDAVQRHQSVHARLRRATRAAWCVADPGSIVPLALLWVPALRSSVKYAAPRPGHEECALAAIK